MKRRPFTSSVPPLVNIKSNVISAKFTPRNTKLKNKVTFITSALASPVSERSRTDHTDHPSATILPFAKCSSNIR
jgi:hypothetical protein